MGLLALVLGILGGLGTIMGVITAAEAVPSLGAEFTTMFWLVLSAVLLLGCIAAAVSRTSYE
jgi:hypothetical protein